MRGLWIVSAGVAAGVLLSLAGTTVMDGLLVGIGARDPVTFAGAAALVAAVSVVASWLPARRAARMPPMQALRQE